MDTFGGRLFHTLMVFVVIIIIIAFITFPLWTALIVSLFSEKFAAIYFLIIIGLLIIYVLYELFKDLYKFLKWLFKGSSK